MKKMAESIIEKMFDEYLESDSSTWSKLNREQHETFYSYQDRIKAGDAAPEDLANVQYMAMKAGFFEGFRAAEKLAAEAKTKK